MLQVVGRRAGLAALVAVAGLFLAGPPSGATEGPVNPSTVHVRVVGNHLVNGAGQTVRLIGVDRSGTEYACIQGWGIFDGPNDAASVAAIAAWHADAVRVPLNEDCWLGINGVSATYGGANYRSAIEAYVRLLNSYGLVAILDLHWNAPGSHPADGQQVMADADHSPAFWSSVGSAFAGTPGVVYDLYNEPHTISWTCWLSGCTTGQGWATAGMQTLLDAVRSSGAGQPVMAGGLGWSGDESGWLAHEPVDPAHQLMASYHTYTFGYTGGCTDATCWNHTIAPLAAQVPVITGEMGDNTCTPTYIDTYMAWADTHGVSYLGWAWNAGGWSCDTGPSYITNYTGTPSGLGVGLKDHLATIADSGGTTLAVDVPTSSPAPPSAPPPAGSGYDLVGADGGVFVFGGAGQPDGFHGSLPALGIAPAAPVVGMVATPGGYFLVGADGGVFGFGTAPFLGSLPGLHITPAAPITGIAAVAGGYFLVGRDGGVYAFGAVPFLGSLPAEHITATVVGIAATPGGYWLVSATGTVYAFGTAQHLGTAPAGASAIAGTPTGGGYWVVGGLGRVSAFGNAPGLGTLPADGVVPTRPVIGIVRSSGTSGYWLLGSDGGIFAFGTAPYDGSLPGIGVHVDDIVAAVPG